MLQKKWNGSTSVLLSPIVTAHTASILNVAYITGGLGQQPHHVRGHSTSRRLGGDDPYDTMWTCCQGQTLSGIEGSPHINFSLIEAFLHIIALKTQLHI